MTASPGSSAQSRLRSAATRGGWSHRVALRGDTLERRRFGYEGAGWRVAAGDLDDSSLPAWPTALPRRALPRGWSPARGTPESPQALSAELPQGVAAGAFGPGWKAYALRSWNPVARGDEPPWHGAWNLRHVAAGAAVALPWTLSLHASETRIARDDADSLSERLLAAGLSSPRGGLSVTGAVMETDGEGEPGWMIAAEGRRRFASGARVAAMIRQRDAAWSSAWDPGVIAGQGISAKESDPGIGAGEAHLSARLPMRGRFGAPTTVSGETWAAWNPGAGTRRRGVRGALGWRVEDLRLNLTGTERAARSASGATSVFRSVEAEARAETFPRGRAAAWRSWNRDGPAGAGLFVGAEPEWGPVRVAPGLRVETRAEDRLEALAALGLQWRMGDGWRLDADGALPCRPGPDAGSARWRIAVSATGR